MTEKRRSPFRESAENRDESMGSTMLRIPQGVNFFKITAAGVKLLDFIPYKTSTNPEVDAGTLFPFRTIHVHRGVGVDEKMYICPQKTFGKKCPICEHRTKLAKAAGTDPDVIKALETKERQLWQVIDAGDPSRGVQLWDVSFHLFGKFLYERIRDADEEDGYDFFYSLKNGKRLKIGFNEESFGGRTFFKTRSIDFKARTEPLDPSLKDKALDLDGILVCPTYDELRDIYFQVEKEDDEEGKTAKSKSKKAAPTDDEDDDVPPPKTKKAAPPTDEDDDAPPPKTKKAAPPTDEDDDAPPPKTKKAGKPAPVDDDDDDAPPPKTKKPAPAESDDEDDAPPPKTKAKKPAPVDEDDDDAPPPKTKPKKSAPAADDSDDDDAPPPSSSKKKNVAKAAETDDDEWDDDPPPSKPAGKKAAKPAPTDDDEWDD